MRRFWKGFFLVCAVVNIHFADAMDAEEVKQLISQDPVLKSAHVGVQIKTAGKPELSVNGDKRFIPASVTKLITTALEWADLQEGYGAEISPLSFNDNFITVVVDKETGQIHCKEQ